MTNLDLVFFDMTKLTITRVMTWIQFHQNAAVITNEAGDPRGSEIRGAVAKEAAEKWPKIASTAQTIV